MCVRMGMIAILVVAIGGCANLKVKKVPVEKRMAGKDHIDGFRYYLSRPYVFVYEPIMVSERKSLVVIKQPVKPTPGKTSAAAGAPGSPLSVQFLDGPRRDQVVALKDLTVATSPGTGLSTRPVSPSELDAIRRVLAAKTDNNVARTSSAQVPPPPAAVPATPPVPAPVTPLPGSDGTVGVPSALPLPPSDDSELLVPNPQKFTANPSAPLAAGPQAPDTTSLTPPDLSKISSFVATTPRKSAKLTGPMQIVFLPDLDEQYAIKSKNCLSKTAFALKFQDGWQLTDVSAQHDSTAVALALLDTIDAAVNAAKDIGIAGLPSSPAAGGAARAPKDVAPPNNLEPSDLYYLYETVFIRPGVYRLNKPWEMEGGPQPVGCGLLAKLGLTMVTQVQLLTAAEAATRDAPPAKPAPTSP